MTKQYQMNNGKITLTAYGAAGEVGRSAFIIEDEKRRILLEAGIKILPNDQLSKAPDGLKERMYSIDAAILSHAHVDHSGYLPALWENGYFGKLYMTEPTLDIVEVLWRDHLKIEGTRHWTPAGLERAHNHTVTVPYRKKVEILDGITIEFYNSGHILGSGMILINWEGFKILYTGDINDQQTPLFEGFEMPDTPIDVLISESTNGSRDVTPRAEINEKFINNILTTLKNGNKVIIPSFALGRSQELLCVLTEHIKDYPIYVDGMINTMNAITEKFLTIDWVDEPILQRLDREGVSSPFRYENIIPITRENFDRTHDFRRYLGQSQEPVIIITTSGMMEPSPVHTHLMHAATYEENLIAVVGYQAEGTKGREIMEGARKVKLSMGRNREDVEVEIKAKIIRYGFSGHTTAEGIHDLIKHVKPKQIYLVHGDPEEQNEVTNVVGNGVMPVSLEPKKPVILAK